MGKFVGEMYAVFLMEPERLGQMRDRMAKRDGPKSKVKVCAHGNGSMALAVGPIQDVMFLIGEVASNGENCLYKAECL